MRWLLVVLVGCWSNSAAPPAPPAQPQPVESTSGGTWHPSHSADRCGPVVSHVYQYVRADPSAAQFPGGMLDELETATLDHCRSTAWSAEALDCYQSSNNISETSTCFALMTDQQRNSWQDLFRDILSRHQGAFGTPPPPPTP